MRIAIVNDVRTTAEALRRFVAGDPSYQLAWIARDGEEAVEKCKLDTPDLILMDLLMPVMDGVEATRRIMAQSPCAILLVTAAMEEHFTRIFEALGAGALDVTQTPQAIGEKGQSQGTVPLKIKIEAIRRIVLDKINLKRGSALDESDGRMAPDGRLIVIGASAGGPEALAAILGDLPSGFSTPIVIVQHVDAEFIPLMANWLNGRSSISVRVARQGDCPRENTALIAGMNDHLVFTNARSLGYTPDPQDCPYRPSIDVFFDSVVRHWNGAVAGVLLTGMGRDGARGLKALRDAGSLTIAQNAATCAVYGMPKAAAELNAAVKILPLAQIAAELTEFVKLAKPFPQEGRPQWTGQIR